jgi:hypothetical protein
VAQNQGNSVRISNSATLRMQSTGNPLFVGWLPGWPSSQQPSVNTLD